MAPKNKNNSLVLAIIVAAVLVTGGLVFLGLSMNSDERIFEGIEKYIAKQEEEASQPAEQPERVEKDMTDDDAFIGSEDAPITIIEFSDYECPYCRRHATETFPQLKENYVDTGKVKYVFRDLPLSFHEPAASEEAIAAECVREQAGNDGYLIFHDLVFANTATNGAGVPEGALTTYATQAGANGATFEKCLADEKYADEVKADSADARSVGLTGTPSFLINGYPVSGAQPYKVFAQVIDTLLAQAEAGAEDVEE